jgi:hypothetical protein
VVLWFLFLSFSSPVTRPPICDPDHGFRSEPATCPTCRTHTFLLPNREAKSDVPRNSFTLHRCDCVFRTCASLSVHPADMPHPDIAIISWPKYGTMFSLSKTLSRRGARRLHYTKNFTYASHSEVACSTEATVLVSE